MTILRVGVIGLGSWGECHLEALSALPHVQVAAVCDRDEERLARAGERFGIAEDRRYADDEALLLRKDIDAVCIVTFERNHLSATLRALQAGKHVLVEKPVTTDYSEAVQMQATAERFGKRVLPAHLLRFDPRYRDIRRGIEDGRIGKPVSIYMRRSRGQGLYRTYQRTHTVYELMVHDIDLAIWYANSRVVRVRAYAQQISGAIAPEVLWACLTFENGTIAILQSDWMTPDSAGIANDDAAEVIGEKGTARFRTYDAGVHFWSPDDGRQTREYHIHAPLDGHLYGALKDQWFYVADHLANGTDPAVLSFKDAVHGIEVADAIVRSGRDGVEVPLT